MRILRRGVGTAITDSRADRIREYLVRHYHGIHVKHSFQDEGGQTWDCIPIHQQPSLRKDKSRVFEKEPPFPGHAPATSEHPRCRSFVQESKTDVFGNRMSCEEGLIPVRRVLPEELLRYSGVDEFLKRSKPRSLPIADAGSGIALSNDGHKYSCGK